MGKAPPFWSTPIFQTQMKILLFPRLVLTWSDCSPFSTERLRKQSLEYTYSEVHALKSPSNLSGNFPLSCVLPRCPIPRPQPNFTPTLTSLHSRCCCSPDQFRDNILNYPGQLPPPVFFPSAPPLPSITHTITTP